MLKSFKFLLLFLIFITSLPLYAQQKAKFYVTSFEENKFDMSAREVPTQRYDGNGDRYAIVKVTSNNPDDNLGAYNFDFGYLQSLVEVKDGEIWVYVQRNAKHVTISRAGYSTFRDYDLGTTIQPGRVYRMKISVTLPTVYKQMLRFNITPQEPGIVVMYHKEAPDAVESYFGSTDENGSVAKNMELGTYIYKIHSDKYRTSEGRIVLDKRNDTHIENVRLLSNYSNVTLLASDGSEIFIDGQSMGHGKWQGALNGGEYKIECRKDKHRTAVTDIFVAEKGDTVINLNLPHPITGTLAVSSVPLDASLTIDGKSYGLTPRVIDSLLIGTYSVRLAKENYSIDSCMVEIRENEITEIERTLTSLVVPASKKEQPASEKKPKKESKKKKQAEPKAANSDIPKAVQPKSPGYFKKHDLYLQAGIGVGGMTPLSVALGCHLWNVNLEIFAAKGLSKETLWANDLNSYTSTQHDFTAVTYGAKLGYGIKLGKRIRLTPQVGIAGMELHEEGKMLRGTSYIMGALKGEYALTKNIGITVMPEYLYNIAGISLYDYGNPIRDQLEYELFRDWSDGFTFTVGLYFKL